ncbi:hypothetical protein BKA65DRAFT_471849 [Rhexocercosporidium sp. MPI-PUGE-AT-0058]|nr:hypothetical protein BKA65DRAFT_471849 [Rhexocercosporidium sp. MPI-PUGE-AT-0058]
MHLPSSLSIAILSIVTLAIALPNPDPSIRLAITIPVRFILFPIIPPLKAPTRRPPRPPSTSDPVTDILFPLPIGPPTQISPVRIRQREVLFRFALWMSPRQRLLQGLDLPVGV